MHSLQFTIYNKNGATKPLPFGELFVSLRNTSFDSRYKFTAKEMNNEKNYSYFGTRYYDSDLSVWLSVDPLADKAPGWSPFR